MKFVNKILFVGKIFFVFVIVQSYVFARDPQKELMSKDTDLKLSSDDKLVRETNKLQKATVTVEKIKNDATTIKDAAKENFDKGKITRAQFAKIIGEQDYIIHQADKKLAQLIDNSIKKFEKIDAEEGYLTQILAPFRSGYGYTQEEKDRARSVISELKKQQLEINRAYTEEIKNIFQKDKRDLFKNNYDNLMQEFEKEIYQQQLITGDAMSTSRKLFWGAIGLAGTVAGGMVGKKYLPSQTQTQKKIDVKDLAFIVGEDISSAAKQVANKWKQSTKEALDRDRLTEAEKFVGGPISKKLREGGASASKKLKEVGVSTSKILKEGAESLLEASRKNPQQEEYFEKEYGPQSTEAIKKLPQDIKSGLTSLRESTREYPAEFEGEEGNYLTSKYGPVVRENAEQAVKKVSQKVSEGRQQVGKFISDTSQAAQESSIGQAISKGLEEGKEFLNKTFGKYFESEVPAVEENSKVEEGL